MDFAANPLIEGIVPFCAHSAIVSDRFPGCPRVGAGRLWAARVARATSGVDLPVDVRSPSPSTL